MLVFTNILAMTILVWCVLFLQGYPLLAETILFRAPGLYYGNVGPIENTTALCESVGFYPFLGCSSMYPLLKYGPLDDMVLPNSTLYAPYGELISEEGLNTSMPCSYYVEKNLTSVPFWLGSGYRHYCTSTSDVPWESKSRCLNGMLGCIDDSGKDHAPCNTKKSIMCVCVGGTTLEPTVAPTFSPTISPSRSPGTTLPSGSPSITPTISPSGSPSISPVTAIPTLSPTEYFARAMVVRTSDWAIWDPGYISFDTVLEDTLGNVIDAQFYRVDTSGITYWDVYVETSYTELDWFRMWIRDAASSTYHQSSLQFKNPDLDNRMGDYFQGSMFLPLLHTTGDIDLRIEVDHPPIAYQFRAKPGSRRDVVVADETHVLFASQTSSQNLPRDTLVVVSFTASYDPSSTLTGGTIYTCPESGVYFLSSLLNLRTLTTTGSGGISGRFRINGVDNEVYWSNAMDFDSTHVDVFRLVPLQAGDTIQLVLSAHDKDNVQSLNLVNSGTKLHIGRIRDSVNISHALVDMTASVGDSTWVTASIVSGISNDMSYAGTAVTMPDNGDYLIVVRVSINNAIAANSVMQVRLNQAGIYKKLYHRNAGWYNAYNNHYTVTLSTWSKLKYNDDVSVEVNLANGGNMVTVDVELGIVLFHPFFVSPTVSPSTSPSISPVSASPSSSPSISPSNAPVTGQPTSSPTMLPSAVPTFSPQQAFQARGTASGYMIPYSYGTRQYTEDYQMTVVHQFWLDLAYTVDFPEPLTITSIPRPHATGLYGQGILVSLDGLELLISAAFTPIAQLNHFTRPNRASSFSLLVSYAGEAAESDEGATLCGTEDMNTIYLNMYHSAGGLMGGIKVMKRSGPGQQYTVHGSLPLPSAGSLKFGNSFSVSQDGKVLVAYNEFGGTSKWEIYRSNNTLDFVHVQTLATVTGSSNNQYPMLNGDGRTIIASDGSNGFIYFYDDVSGLWQPTSQDLTGWLMMGIRADGNMITVYHLGGAANVYVRNGDNEFEFFQELVPAATEAGTANCLGTMYGNAVNVRCNAGVVRFFLMPLPTSSPTHGPSVSPSSSSPSISPVTSSPTQYPTFSPTTLVQEFELALDTSYNLPSGNILQVDVVFDRVVTDSINKISGMNTYTFDTPGIYFMYSSLINSGFSTGQVWYRQAFYETGVANIMHADLRMNSRYGQDLAEVYGDPTYTVNDYIVYVPDPVVSKQYRTHVATHTGQVLNVGAGSSFKGIRPLNVRHLMVGDYPVIDMGVSEGTIDPVPITATSDVESLMDGSNNYVVPENGFYFVGFYMHGKHQGVNCVRFTVYIASDTMSDGNCADTEFITYSIHALKYYAAGELIKLSMYQRGSVHRLSQSAELYDKVYMMQMDGNYIHRRFNCTVGDGTWKNLTFVDEVSSYEFRARDHKFFIDFRDTYLIQVRLEVQQATSSYDRYTIRLNNEKDIFSSRIRYLAGTDNVFVREFVYWEVFDVGQEVFVQVNVDGGVADSLLVLVDISMVSMNVKSV